MELIDPGLLSILEQEKESSKDDSGFSLSKTTSSTRRLWKEVRQFEERTIEEKDDSIGEQFKDKKVFENVQKLNIRDIRNDTSSDLSRNIDEGEQHIIMMQTQHNQLTSLQKKIMH